MEQKINDLQNYLNIEFVQNLQRLAEQKMPGKFWDTVEANFIAFFERLTEDDLQFKMDQGMISNYIEIFKNCENERVCHLLQKQTMRYSDNVILVDKVRQKQFRLIFKYLFFIKHHRLPLFEYYIYELAIKFATKYQADEFDLKKASYCVQMLNPNKTSNFYQPLSLALKQCYVKSIGSLPWPDYEQTYRNVSKLFKYPGDPIIHLITFQKLKSENLIDKGLYDIIDIIQGFMLVKKYSNGEIDCDPSLVKYFEVLVNKLDQNQPIANRALTQLISLLDTNVELPILSDKTRDFFQNYFQNDLNIQALTKPLLVSCPLLLNKLQIQSDKLISAIRYGSINQEDFLSDRGTHILLDQIFSQEITENSKKLIVDALSNHRINYQILQKLISKGCDYQSFPEIWDLTVKKLQKNHEQLFSEQILQILNCFSQANYDGDMEVINTAVCFKKPGSKKDIQSLIELRNTYLRMQPNNHEILTNLETNVVNVMYSFGFKKQGLYPAGATIVRTGNTQNANNARALFRKI